VLRAVDESAQNLLRLHAFVFGTRLAVHEHEDASAAAIEMM
jgi:hypothetical protein